MRQGRVLANIAIVTCSLLLVGSYVTYRARGTLFSTSEAAPKRQSSGTASTQPESQPILPGSKSKAVFTTSDKPSVLLPGSKSNIHFPRKDAKILYSDDGDTHMSSSKSDVIIRPEDAPKFATEKTATTQPAPQGE